MLHDSRKFALIFEVAIPATAAISFGVLGCIVGVLLVDWLTAIALTFVGLFLGWTFGELISAVLGIPVLTYFAGFVDGNWWPLLWGLTAVAYFLIHVHLAGLWNDFGFVIFGSTCIGLLGCGIGGTCQALLRSARKWLGKIKNPSD